MRRDTTFIAQPGIQEIKSLESLNTSLLEWYNKVVLGQNLETAATQGSSWIDVRDLSIAHMKAIENEEAGGERIIVSQGVFTDCRIGRTSFTSTQDRSSGRIGVRS